MLATWGGVGGGCFCHRVNMVTHWILSWPKNVSLWVQFRFRLQLCVPILSILLYSALLYSTLVYSTLFPRACFPWICAASHSPETIHLIYMALFRNQKTIRLYALRFLSKDGAALNENLYYSGRLRQRFRV